MHLRCPHCHGPIELVDGPLTNIACPSCGSSFSLVSGETTETYRGDVGRELGHFKLVRQLGAGAFGSVWLARDTELDRQVAVKLPRQDNLSAHETELFFREARAAAQLKHPGIVSVHEVGRQDKTVYIVSEFIEGADLKEWLSGQRLSSREAAELVVKIALALDHAHEAGVIHRDLKPGNIMLDLEGEPHITDFGLAKRDSGEITMTLDGYILGTPAYMPPEQARGAGHAADRRSDIYSLGIILFELLTGELPFRGDKRMLLVQIQREKPPSPRKFNARLARDLETITLKCLEKEPHRRYWTAAALADDIERHIKGEAIHARPISRIEHGWRWAKRNRALASVTAALFLVFVTGFAVSSLQWLRAERERTAALASRDAAEDATREAKRQGERAEANAAEAQRQKDQAEQSERLANQQRELAETQLYFNQIRYVAHILKSDTSLAVGRLGQAELARREWEWRYLWRLAQADVRELKPDRQRFFVPHEQPATFSPDLVRIIEDDSGRLLYVWRQDDRLFTGLVDNREQVAPLSETTIEGDQLALSPGGIYAAALDTSSDILTVWLTLHPAEQVRVLGVRGTLPPWGISDDGQWFGIVVSKSQSHLRRVGDDLTITIRHGRTPEFMGFSAGGDFLVSWHGQIHLYSAADLRGKQPDHVQFQRLVGHDAGSLHVAMDPQGEWLAAASRNNGVMLWNAETREIAQTFSGGRGATRSLSFSHNGQRLATLDRGGTLHIWDRRSGQPLLEWDEVVSGNTTISFGPRDRYLFGFQTDGGIAKWHAELPPPDGILRGHQELLRMVELSPDGHRLLSSSYDGTAKLWDTETEQELLILRGHTAPVDEVRFQPHGQLIATGSWDRTVRLWDADTGTTLHVLEGHTDRVAGLAFHPDGKLLASVDMDGIARLWDVDSGALLRTMNIGAEQGYRLAFSPDGKQLAAGTSRGAVVWRTSDWQVAYRINAHKRDARFVTYSPDGRTIASSGFDKQIHLTDAATGEHLGRLGAHRDLVYSLAFSPDGRLLVSTSRDKLLKYWNVEQRRLVAETRFSKGFPMVALFFPDGKRVVTAGWDKVVRFLDVPPNALRP